MNDYFDWAYGTYYFSTRVQPESSPTGSGPTSERANDASRELHIGPRQSQQARRARGDWPEAGSAARGVL
jgi:hypothetical protein